MIVAPYVHNQDYDDYFKNLILMIRETINNKDDDFVLLTAGTTGTGKTSLSLHAFELYDNENCDVKYIGLNPKDHSIALRLASQKPDNRFCLNDEANISRRDSLTKYNKDFIKTLFAIRGLKIFHWLNNPTADYLDKILIKERIKGLILIFTKDKNRPRLYYYFTKDDLLRILDKYGHIEFKLLKSVARKYASWRGWFKPYNGKLWNSYLEKKTNKMEDVITEFYNNYGDGEEATYNSMSASKVLGCSAPTINTKVKRAIKDNMIPSTVFNITGRLSLSKEQLEILKNNYF